MENHHASVLRGEVVRNSVLRMTHLCYVNVSNTQVQIYEAELAFHLQVVK